MFCLFFIINVDKAQKNTPSPKVNNPKYGCLMTQEEYAKLIPNIYGKRVGIHSLV